MGPCVARLPDGQITRSGGGSLVESFFYIEAKFSCSSRRANQNYNCRRPGPQRGVSRSSLTLGRDAVDAAASGAIVVAGQVRWTRERSDGAPDERRRSPAKPFGEDGWLRTAKACGFGTRCWC